MGLLSKSKSKAPDTPQPRSGAAPLADASEVGREARVRARRRLIGAALLLGVGIIGFPLLFETQPRPIAVDIPIEIPSREGAPALQAPAARPARVAPAPLAAPPAETRPDPKPEAKPEVKIEAKIEAKAEAPKPVIAEVRKPAETASKADTAKDNNDAAKDDGRFVVQIGAFAEASGAREARMKVEAMGLKTYTQVIESSSGRRIRVRVGPYATKAEADKAASRIKSGGLQAAVLVL